MYVVDEQVVLVRPLDPHLRSIQQTHMPHMFVVIHALLAQSIPIMNHCKLFLTSNFLNNFLISQK